jgi:hypothetical protein
MTVDTDLQSPTAASSIRTSTTGASTTGGPTAEATLIGSSQPTTGAHTMADRRMHRVGTGFVETDRTLRGRPVEPAGHTIASTQSGSATSPLLRTLQIVLLFALAAVALSWKAVAQDLATTLAQATDRADATVLARVLQTGHDALGQHTATLVVLERLTGNDADFAFVGQVFTLREPAGEACGRALSRLVAGPSLLAFLRRDTATGQPRLFVSNARALLMPNPDVVQHVRALATTGTATQRARMLALALASADTRVASDAALELSVSIALDAVAADARCRQSVGDALRSALGHDARRAAALLRVAARAGLTETRETVFSALVGRDPADTTTDRPLRTARSLADLLTESLQSMDPTGAWTAGRVLALDAAPRDMAPGAAPDARVARLGCDRHALARSGAGRRRLGRFLGRHAPGSDEARTAMLALAKNARERAGDRTFCVRATKTLLDAGMAPDALRAVLGSDTVSAASARSDLPGLGSDPETSPRLRAVRPGKVLGHRAPQPQAHGR